jgi:hypothetical protein
VLVRGVERRCHIATEPDARAGRPEGLYGHRFARAEASAVERAVTVLERPTLSNLIAMEAPSCGRGVYSRDQIEDVLENAFTGFSAAVQESGAAGALVHTGFWGCGAYGGNRTLMAVLQLLAARLAGLAELVFHTVDAAGTRDYARALAIQKEQTAGGAPLATIVAQLVARRFHWGESDGN